ncbi:TlyA family RNA methyltransferase [Helicobacter sp. Faydin-H64]|uniref:TlyA family RNA methyltransferase n=2 Tax=Helicobacter turcicus TaxID=2867412 RepID=A0ABS7JKM0_9HELI|nr:TlyA family RNA methyltransferase [Helicobacter turcicus]MBX7544797.1 TlyA family RNA methyltransferase [Helicobacter turcicus]
MQELGIVESEFAELANLRLDIACVKLGIAPTRNKAHTLIRRGKVCVNGIPCMKSAYKLSTQDRVRSLESKIFVSRAGEKLCYFLKEYPILDFKGKNALDIGASTGGFCEVLLQKGVESVVCVDVGNNQLHDTLRENPHVISYENTDIRDFAKEYTKNCMRGFEIVVCDVSFIGLKDILDSIIALSSDKVILLFKPQFEVGREVKRNKKGVVQDKLAIQKALGNMLKLLEHSGFGILKCAESEIAGKEGNVEFFIACQKL